MLETFFCGSKKHVAIRELLEELGKHAWLATMRRMNWEEFGAWALYGSDRRHCRRYA
jgi:hypothetical protein